MLKYLGIKMYLVRLRKPPLGGVGGTKVADWVAGAGIAQLVAATTGVAAAQQ